MPGNDSGDRLHNFFRQDNSPPVQHHQQIADGAWSVVNNNLWVGNSPQQFGVSSANTNIYNLHHSDTDRGQSNLAPHGSRGLNFTQTMSDFARHPSQNQQLNLNGCTFGSRVNQTRQDEVNISAVDSVPDQYNFVPQHQTKSPVRSGTSESPVSFDLFGNQQQMQRQQPAFSDMHPLQQQLIFRKMQELQRQQLDGRVQNAVNPVSSFAKQSSGSYPDSGNNLQGAVVGNMNWQQNASPVNRGSPNGLVYSSQQGDQSFYGFPVSGSRGNVTQLPQMATFPNSLPGNQYTAFSGESLVSGQRYPGENSYGQENSVQRIASPQENREEVRKIASSENEVCLDPTEERILFGSDDNIFGAFAKDPDLSEEGGTWSALMQSAVAETSISDTGQQDDLRGMNISVDPTNQHPAFSGRQEMSFDSDMRYSLNTSVPSPANCEVNHQPEKLSQHSQGYEHKRVMGGGVDGGLFWNSTCMPQSFVAGNLPTTRDGNSVGPPKLNNTRFNEETSQHLSIQGNYWKNVNPMGSHHQINRDNEMADSSLNTWNKAELTSSQRETYKQRGNSQDSHTSNLSANNETGLSDVSDSRSLPSRNQKLVNQNMLELLDKVDQSRDHASMMRATPSGHNVPSEKHETDNSGSGGNRQGFGLHLGPPSHRTAVSSQHCLPQNSHQSQVAPEFMEKGQSLASVLGRIPGEFKRNRSGLAGQAMNNAFMHKLQGNLSWAPSSGNTYSNQLQYLQHMARTSGQVSIDQYDNSGALADGSQQISAVNQHSGGWAPPSTAKEPVSVSIPVSLSGSAQQGTSLTPPPNMWSNIPHVHKAASNVPQLYQGSVLESSSVAPQREAEKDAGSDFNSPSVSGSSSMNRDSPQKDFTDGSPARSAIKRKDIEAFGQSLVSNNDLAHQHYSLLNQMQTMKRAEPDTNHEAFEKMNGQMLAVNDTCLGTIPETAEQPFSLGKSNSMEQVAEAVAVDPGQHLNIPQSSTVLTVAMDPQSRPKKRKRRAFCYISWHKQVQESQIPQTMRMAEEVWAKSVNRIPEKIEDEVDLSQNRPTALKAKRRLSLTTHLMQQLISPPMSSILSLDAESSYEDVAYFIARLALGEACGLVSHSSNERHLSKIVKDFSGRARNLETNFLRLEKKVSLADIRVECQELEKFSVINRFAKFHGRGQSETLNSDVASKAPRPYLQRYVTALPAPRSLPDRVHCLPL